MKELKSLRARAKRLDPAVRIGKNGLTENTLKEIDKVLVTRHLVKIKMLKTAFEKGEKEKLINDIIASTDAELVDCIGNVFVIYRRL